jgi:GDP-L-fucose synthase
MMDKNSKIYIAGHKGLVGSAIHRYLTGQGYTNVIGKSSQELDLTDQETVEAYFAEEKPDYVFLAAAKVGGIMANNTYRAEFIYSNLEIQNNIIQACYEHKVKKLLFLGSSCIYPKDAPQPIKEDSLLTGPLEYTNEPYAIAKIAGIKMIESYNVQYGTNFLAVQPTNLYGYNDNFDLEKSHVMPALIRKNYLCKLLEDGNFEAIAKNLGMVKQTESQILAELNKHGIIRRDDEVVLKVWGTGKPYREFLHVDDMAEACVYVMNKVNFSDLTKDMTEIRNTQINIGTGQDMTISDLAHKIRDIVGFKGSIEFDTSKPDGTMRKLLSVEKINTLGWKHKIELEGGLRTIAEWYIEKGQYA